MNMLSLTRFHIIWNGTPLPAIVPSKGVRQGDPLSLYLFILYLERLSILLEEAVQDRAIHPITFHSPFKSTRSKWIPCNFLLTELAHSWTRHYSCR